MGVLPAHPMLLLFFNLAWVNRGKESMMLRERRIQTCYPNITTDIISVPHDT